MEVNHLSPTQKYQSQGTNHGKAQIGMPLQAACDEPSTPHSHDAQWNPCYTENSWGQHSWT